MLRQEKPTLIGNQITISVLEKQDAQNTRKTNFNFYIAHKSISYPLQRYINKKETKKTQRIPTPRKHLPRDISIKKGEILHQILFRILYEYNYHVTSSQRVLSFNGSKSSNVILDTFDPHIVPLFNAEIKIN